MQKLKKMYLKKVTDVDNKGIGVRFHGHPFRIFHELKPTNMFILVQDGEEIAICVGHESENLWGYGAWRVPIKPHKTCARVTVVFPYPLLYSHIRHKDFWYRLC